MYKKFKMIIVVMLLLLFSSCGSMITYIENVDNYTSIPFIEPDNSLITIDNSRIHLQPEILHRNFETITLILNDYYTIETERINIFTSVPPEGRVGNYRSSVGRRYNFHKGDELIYRFEIITNSYIVINENGSQTAASRRYIRIINEYNFTETQIEPYTINDAIYFELFDEEIGNFVIRDYKSRSANQSPNSRWRYHTGFLIEIDNEEYGILAFYPDPIFHKNNSFAINIDEQIENKIMLYIFMAYIRYTQEENIFYDNT